MSNLLEQIKAIDAAIAQAHTQGFARNAPLQIEPRSERRQKARDLKKSQRAIASSNIASSK